MDNKEIMNLDEMEKPIVIDDGKKRYPVTNKQGELLGILVINPSDIGIIDRYEELSNMMEEVSEKLRKIGATETGESDDSSFAEQIRIASDEIKGKIDYLFDGNVSETFFAKNNPFSPCNGKFFVETVIDVIGSVIEKEFDTSVKKAQKRVAKYTDRKAPRYHK